MIVVHVVVAIHLQRNTTIGSGPSLDTNALVEAFLERALAVARTSVLASS